MTEIDYHIKIRIHWGVFALACLLIVGGMLVTFAPKTERVDLYSDKYYTYYVDVTTYPYGTLGLVIDALGWLLLIASFFVGQKQEVKSS